MATKKATSTAVVKAKIDLPANAEEMIAADIERMKAQLSAPSGNRIAATQDRKFKDADGNKHDSIQGIIVDFIAKKAFYPGAYDKDDIVPPDCFAMGFVKLDDLVMDEESPNPQMDAGEECRTCAMNQYKTADNGRGKACKDSFVLALLPPDADADTPMQTLSISATATKPFSKYLGDLMAAGLPPFSVVTTFTMDSNVDFASIRAGSPEKVDQEMMALAYSRREEAQKLLSVKPQFETPAEAPQKTTTGKKVVPAKVVRKPLRKAA